MKVVSLIWGFVGLLCYTPSPSFDPLTRSWKPFSIIFYEVVCLIILGIIWFAKHASPFAQQSRTHLQLLKACPTFVVFVMIPVYSFFYDKAVGEKPHILSVISNVMFTIMSLSLHKHTKLGFEIGVTAYFFGCFTIQMLTIKWMSVFVSIIFGCLLFAVRLSEYSTRGRGGKGTYRLIYWRSSYSFILKNLTSCLVRNMLVGWHSLVKQVWEVLSAL